MTLNLYCRSDAWRATHLRLADTIFATHVELPVSECQSALLLSKDPLDMDHAALAEHANRLEKTLELGLPAFGRKFEHARHGASSLAKGN